MRRWRGDTHKWRLCDSPPRKGGGGGAAAAASPSLNIQETPSGLHVHLNNSKGKLLDPSDVLCVFDAASVFLYFYFKINTDRDTRGYL